MPSISRKSILTPSLPNFDMKTMDILRGSVNVKIIFGHGMETDEHHDLLSRYVVISISFFPSNICNLYWWICVY